MKIIVLSDNHGDMNIVKRICEKHSDADMILHCGDLEGSARDLPEMFIVRGNNDYYGDFEDYKIIEVLGHKILLIHGHQFSYFKRLESMIDKATQMGCDIVCHGHTHVAKIDEIEGKLYLNPGSCWRSRDGLAPSYAILTIEDHKMDAKIVRI